MKTAISLFLLLVSSSLFSQETPFGVKFTAYSTDTTIQKCEVKYCDTKLYFLYAKEMSRFLHVDPMAEKYPSFTPYHMAMNNPIMFVDPTGMWSATYDSASNTVHATAEEGDTFEDFYKQTNMTKEEFEKWASENGYDLSQGANEFSFNITSLVYKNSTVDPNNKNSNCFGFVLASNGTINPEIQSQGMEFMSQGGFGTNNQTAQGKTGDVAVWNYSGNMTGVGDLGNIQNTPAHAGLFLLTNRAGENMFLNRSTLGAPISVSTNSQVNSSYNAIQSGLTTRNPGIGFPNIFSNPTFYKR